MTLDDFKKMQEAHRQARKPSSQPERSTVIERYLPDGFDAAEAGYPSTIEVLLQWELRNRGCIYAAQQIFLDRPMPSTREERTRLWYICMALVNAATRAFDDLNAIIDWYTENWTKDRTALQIAMEENDIHECLGPLNCPIRQKLNDRDTADESTPSSYLT